MPLSRLISAKRRQKNSPRVGLTRWWRRLSPQRQDRFAVLAPLAAVLLFLAAIAAAFGYLRLEEIDREQEAVKRDVEYTQQRLRLRLLERQEQLMRIAREVTNQELDPGEFRGRAEAIVNQYPELQSLTWIDQRLRVKASFAAASVAAYQIRSAGDKIEPGETENTLRLARELQQPIYSQPAGTAKAPAVLQLHIPLSDRAHFLGVLLAEYSVDGLFRYGVPAEVSARYALSLHDGEGALLAGTANPHPNRTGRLLPWASPANVYEVPVSPVGNGLIIRGQTYRTSLGVIGSGLFWLVMALSMMTTWMLIANWRHSRRRMRA